MVDEAYQKDEAPLLKADKVTVSSCGICRHYSWKKQQLVCRILIFYTVRITEQMITKPADLALHKL